MFFTCKGLTWAKFYFFQNFYAKETHGNKSLKNNSRVLGVIMAGEIKEKQC